MTNLTPPPEEDLDPQRRQAIRATLQDAQPGSRRTPILAAAAVAAIVAAGIAVPQLRSDDRPQPSGTGPSTVTKPTAGPTAGSTQPRPRTRRIPLPTPGRGSDRLPEIPRQPPKDAVAICRDEIRDWLGPSQMPGKSAREVARIDGTWGVTMVLTDGKRWVGCDTANYTYYGKASLLEPRKFTRPSNSDADAFAVSNRSISEPAGPTLDFNAPIHPHYFAAGVLPAGVAQIRYTFPDGVAETATVSGRFWLVEHLESAPNASSDRKRITVELLAADGSVIREHRLRWGDQTCAHINHGC